MRHTQHVTSVCVCLQAVQRVVRGAASPTEECRAVLHPGQCSPHQVRVHVNFICYGSLAQRGERGTLPGLEVKFLLGPLILNSV